MPTPHSLPTGISALVQLQPEALELYRYVAERGEVKRDELHDRAALAGSDVPMVDQLLELRLLRPSSTHPDVLLPGAPEATAAELLGPASLAVAEAHRTVESARDRLALFQDLYDQAQKQERSGNSGGIEVITDLDEVRRAISSLAASACEEILTSQPGGARKEEVLHESLARTEEVLRRGVRMRTLYQHTAQFSTVTVEYVAHVSQLGVEVRTLGDGFMRMLAFDRATAVIATRDSDTGAVLVREPGLVDFAVGAFERAWTSATPFPEQYNQERVLAISDEMKLAIVRMLVQGLEDRAIARRMGMSLRTCQRHVSDIMDKLGARSRLHAGYLIHALGLDRDPSEG